MTTVTELQLMESQEARERYMDKVEVLERVKALVLLSDDTHTTVEMVSNYYDVDIDTIKKNIERHKEELISDGMKVLEGEQLRDFKSLCQIQSRAKALTIIPRRAILRIGMLLRDSDVAKRIRTYLLNIEQNSSTEDKMRAVLQDNSNKLTSIEQQNIQLITQNNWLVSQNKEMFSHVSDISVQMDDLEKQINEMKTSFVFKQYTNPSYKFNDLVHKLGYKFNVLKESKHFTDFYVILQNWLGEKFPEVSNTKQYVLNVYGIDVVEKLINGILIGRIVKNKNNNWIDLNGYSQNDVEFERIKKEFNYECAYCGNESKILIPEHIIAQSQEFSTDVIYNIVPACKSCNASKFDTNAKEWYSSQTFYSEERRNKLNEHWNKYYIKLSVNS